MKKYPIAAAGHFANVFSFIFFSNPVSKLSGWSGLLLASQSGYRWVASPA